MKKFVIILSLLFTCLFTFSPAVSAVNVFSCSGAANNTDVCKSVSQAPPTNPVISVLKKAIDIISFIIGVAAVIVLIVAGLQFITGGGDPQSVTNARNMLIYAIVGVFIAVLAQTIVVFVLDKLG